MPDPLHNKSKAVKAWALYTPQDFEFEREAKRCVCPAGQALYGNGKECNIGGYIDLRHNKQLNRFTLRSQAKVDGQCKLYALVHNIEKLAHHGYAQKGKPGN